MNDALSELRRDLNIAFEKMRAMSGQLEILQQAHMEDATAKADPGPERKAHSENDAIKHICYRDNPEAADELARFINDAIEHILNATQD